MQITRRANLVAIVSGVAGYLALGSRPVQAGSLLPSASDVPLPADVKIIPPAPTIPRELALFSGKWFGVWGNCLPGIIVVESIEPPNAEFIYAYGTCQFFHIYKSAWLRVAGKFEAGVLNGTLNGDGPHVAFKLNNDGTMAGDYKNGVSSAIFHRM